MKYFHYKAEKGNFGDDLNPWLWGQLFKEDENNDDNILLGIGTMLFNDFGLIKAIQSNQKKIVFGAGIRPNYKKFKIDNTWDIRFLRGPLSSASLNNDYKFISDAAYATRFIDGFDDIINLPKKYEVGLMPYFRSMDIFDWEKICEELGFRLISPYSENGVEYTLKEIASSKVVITEAMHGAILADVLRVPWSRYILTTPYTEGAMVSEFKWMDWQHSINLGATDSTFIEFYKKTRLNYYLKKISFDIVESELLQKKKVEGNLITTLKSIRNFYLSDDFLIKEIDAKIGGEISNLKTDLTKNIYR